MPVPDHREPVNTHSIQLLDTFRIEIVPGRIVLGAGRQDLNVGERQQPLGDLPGMCFGASDNPVAISLDHNGDSIFLHASVLSDECEKFSIGIFPAREKS